MRSFLGGLGVLMLLGASAMLVRGSGQDWEYNLVVSKNASSGSYYISSGHPTNKHYRLDDGYETRIFFTNSTGDSIKVRVGNFELTATANECPIASPGCVEDVPNIPNTETRLVTLEANPSLSEDDFGEQYDFLFSAGMVGGALNTIDPDLEIDRNFYFLYQLLAALLGLLLSLGSWFTRPRAAKP